ncbi:hypothetical protein UlMin_004579 [Ulmus minor]
MLLCWSFALTPLKGEHVALIFLCDTMGFGNLTGSDADADAQKIAEETNRILAEIRLDSDSTDADELPELEINPQSRVFPLTGSPPKPCDNPIGDHYLLKSIKNKIDYYRVHGIKIVYNIAHLDKELAGYWAKLPMIRRLMLSHPEVEWIWWMDSDALFTDMKSWIALNTGSFMFRNFQCKGRLAFEADDQSALIYLLISKQKKWMDKVFVENSYFLHEMMEKYHPGLGDERWPFVTHFGNKGHMFSL